MLGQEKRKGMEVTTEGKFPEGLRVLVVDDNLVCQKILEHRLRHCKYQPTMVMDVKIALKILREGKEEFDLVISEVHMPDMDGFMLLDTIRLEMDLPVIMLSMDAERETVVKVITHGACAYLVKPVSITDLKNIWQHVVRRTNPEAMKHYKGDDNDDDDQRVQPGTSMCRLGGAKRKNSSNNINDGVNSSENKESTIRKKSRVVWTGELHYKFLEAINRTGLDRAVPKKILEMMNVDYLTRESIASHLQAYKFYMKRVGHDTSGSNPFGEVYDRRNTSNSKMNRKVSFNHFNEHEGWITSSSVTSWCPKNLRATGENGVLTPIHSAQLRNTKSNLSMGSFVHGERMLGHVMPQLPDARRFTCSYPLVNSSTNIQNDKVDASPSYPSNTSYVDILRCKLMETSKCITPCHLGKSFANVPSGGMPTSTDEFLMQPPESVNQMAQLISNTKSIAGFSGESMVPINKEINQIMVGTLDLPNSSSMVPTKFATSGNITSSVESLSDQMMPSNVAMNTSLVGMFNAYGSSSMPLNQHNDESITPLVVGCKEKITSLNIATNTSFVGMMPAHINHSLSQSQMVNGGSTESALSNLQMDSSNTSTQILHGRDDVGTLPTQKGTVDQLEFNDQINDNNAFSLDDILANAQLDDNNAFSLDDIPDNDQLDYNNSYSLDDIVAKMLKDFTEDDEFIG